MLKFNVTSESWKLDSKQGENEVITIEYKLFNNDGIEPILIETGVSYVDVGSTRYNMLKNESVDDTLGAFHSIKNETKKDLLEYDTKVAEFINMEPQKFDYSISQPLLECLLDIY